MSEFFSDFLSYVTASVIVAASLLAEAQTPSPDQSLISLDDAIPIDRLAKPDIVPAELTKVIFARNGENDRAQPARKSPPMGVVSASAVNLRAGPGTDFAVRDQALRGARFELTGQREGPWIEIHDADQDRQLWVHGRFFDAQSPPGQNAFLQNR